MPTPRGERIRAARLIQRDQLFPDSEGKVWSVARVGYNPIPRILPLLSHLFEGKEEGNPTRVYFELWCRAYDVGFAEIRSEEEAAYASGYTGQRAVRTWRNHIAKLKRLGFIEIAPRGNLKNGFILLHDPFRVVARKMKMGLLPQFWIAAFHSRCLEVGTKLPPQLVAAIEADTARRKKQARKSPHRTP